MDPSMPLYSRPPQGTQCPVALSPAVINLTLPPHHIP